MYDAVDLSEFWMVYVYTQAPPQRKKETFEGILDEFALRCAFWKVVRICTLCIFASDVCDQKSQV